jgi:hypothetical protein
MRKELLNKSRKIQRYKERDKGRKKGWKGRNTNEKRGKKELRMKRKREHFNCPHD